MIRNLLQFIDKSPTPVHVVKTASCMLEKEGFVNLNETESLTGLKAGKYFITRNNSSIIAITIPNLLKKDFSFRLVGAHTDSPHLRLKPNSLTANKNYYRLHAEVYGGAILYSWFDRDLGLAGRIFCQSKNDVTEHLLTVRQPVCRIPSLAIHLNREMNESFKIDRFTDILPVFALSPKDQTFEEFLADKINIAKESVISYDISLFDTQLATIGGKDSEFIFSARLDNLAMCHAALTALLNSRETQDLCGIALFDHEEVGSKSHTGAASAFLENILERCAIALRKSREEYLASLTRSIFISADMAHAFHPNYATANDDINSPMLNAGPVIKVNHNQRYSTSAETEAFFAGLAAKLKIPIQKYSHRNDMTCGSTIGPEISSRLGMRTVDVGNAMLSMHSIREMAGSADHVMMTKVLTEFFS